jgi:hypothetical protein
MIWFNNVTETVEGVDLVKNLIKVCTGVADGTATWEVYGTTDADLAALISRVTTLETVTIPDLEQAIADALAEAKDYADSLPHENTTYVISEGTENGKIKVTPSEGDAYEVPVHGLGTAAYHAEGDFVSSTDYVAYSQAEKDKLAGIEEGAEVNIIETVKVNGVALTPDADRAVDVEVPVLGVSGDILSLGEDKKISATVALSYASKADGGDGYIKLTGKDGASLGSIDAAEFIKDGMIETVAWSTVEGKENTLVITWNTDAGSKSTEIDFAKYIDTWTHRDAANGVAVVDDKYVGVVDGDSEAFLTVGANGFKLSGVAKAIEDAVAEALAAAKDYTDDSIAALDADVTSAEKYTVEVTDAEGVVSTEEVNHKVRVQVVEADGIVTDVVVTESDIASAAALAALDDEVQEHELIVSAALNDLKASITNAEDSIVEIQEVIDGLNVGVTSVTASTSSAHVTVAPTTTTEGDVTVTVDVASVDAADGGSTGLATDAYVREQVA